MAEYDVSADGHKLLYRTGGGGGGGRGRGAAAADGGGGVNLFLVDADRNAPQAGQGRLSATLRMYLDPKDEFKQIFNEGWRNQRDYLYVPNMHGTDWVKDKQMYGALLPYVNHRADLNYLIDNMGAEISIGHSYVRGGAMPELPLSIGGLLGADFAIDNGRYKITRIYDNESWNPDLRAPLASPGVEVSVGDYILAINGFDLKAPDNIYRLLDGKANRQTVLTVNSKPSPDGARQVTVVPVANEQGLRTRAWVEHNRREVEKLSGGQLAYVYLPNTGQPGYQLQSLLLRPAGQEGRGHRRALQRRQVGGGLHIDARARPTATSATSPVAPFTIPRRDLGSQVMIIARWRLRRRPDTIISSAGRSACSSASAWGGLVRRTPTFIDGGSMIAAPATSTATANGRSRTKASLPT